jgi:MoaA/NifB/PqqE/SkfB family radical SAM enzyme
MKIQVLMLNITDKCNSRCIMCGVWNKKVKNEMRVNEIESFLKQNAESLKHVKTVGLVGGEPFLHNDYVSIIKNLTKYLPKLKSIGTPTNCLSPERYIKSIEESLKVIPEDIFYGVSISLDGLGEVHNDIKRIPDSFDKCVYIIDKLTEEFYENDNFYSTLTSTISHQNVDQIDDLMEFASNKNLRITLRPAQEVDSDYIDNVDDCSDKSWSLDNKDKEYLTNKFHDLYLSTLNEYYKMISDLFAGEQRTYGCPFQDEGLIINPDWKSYMCLFSNTGYLGDLNENNFDLNRIINNDNYSRVRKKLISEVCINCPAECFTSRSSKVTKSSIIKDTVKLVLEEKYEEAKEMIGKFSKNNTMVFLNNFLEYHSKDNYPGDQCNTPQDKIFYRSIHSNKSEYEELLLERNGVSITFPVSNNKEEFMINAFLNIAKYYYVVKIYQEATNYIEILEENFTLNQNLKSEIDVLRNKMNLAI